MREAAINENTPRSRAALALLLLVPAPSLGVLFGLYLAKGPLGQAVWMASKLWIVAMPLLWHLWVDKQKVSFARPTGRGMLAGMYTGVAILVGIVGFYMLLGYRLIDSAVVQRVLGEAGLGERGVYLMATVYWITANSLIEEYVWRWFVFRQGEAALRSAGGAVVLSAALFSLHHLLATRAYFDPLPAVLATAGVFIGGLTWSWLYRRYRSVWPGYLSHVFADIAVFGIGWWLLFR